MNSSVISFHEVPDFTDLLKHIRRWRGVQTRAAPSGE